MTSPVFLKQAVILANRILAEDIHELTLRPELPGGESFMAGQYLMVQVEGEGVRPYSLASPPSRPHEIQICFHRIPQGPVSTHLAGLREGDRITYTGPHGRFVVRDDTARDLLFVAAGTGIAPLRSMILDRFEHLDTRRIDLVFGTRHRKDLIYQEEFRHLESHYANFHYHVCLSRAGEEEWTGHRGRVTALLPRLFWDLREREAYVCGRPEMVRDTIEILVELLIPRERCYQDD